MLVRGGDSITVHEICENAVRISTIEVVMSFEVVLWDFGGVLTSSPFAAFNRYEAKRSLPHDFIRGVNARNHTDNAWAKFESSRCTVAEFDALFAAETAAAGHEIRGYDVIGLLGGDVRPRMVDVLRRCKREYRVACLTNNAKAGQGTGMSNTDEQADDVQAVMRLFDVIIESSKEGLRKPDPRIYELACQRVGVAPQAVVYLDDLGINLKPAREMGMTTIKVISEQQAIDDLGRVLGITFSV
jgi:putative hydrolase of the HAD superfamily